MSESTSGTDAADGRLLGPDRVADHLAIQDLATAYAYAVDDKDWARWEALFTPGAHVDYLAAGGIAGTAAESRRTTIPRHRSRSRADSKGLPTAPSFATRERRVHAHRSRLTPAPRTGLQPHVTRPA